MEGGVQNINSIYPNQQQTKDEKFWREDQMYLVCNNGFSSCSVLELKVFCFRFGRITFFKFCARFKLFFLVFSRLLSLLTVVLFVDRRFAPPKNHIAYFLVHSRASSVYLSLSVLNILAISGTSGSSGFGSHSKEQMDSNTLEMVSAGDHCDLRMSRQMLPLELMFG